MRKVLLPQYSKSMMWCDASSVKATLVFASGGQGLIAMIVNQVEFNEVGGLLAPAGARGGSPDLPLADPDRVLLRARSCILTLRCGCL